MNTVRMTNFLRGLIVLGVAFAFLMSYGWFQTLIRSLLIGFTVLAVGFVVWYSYKFYRKVRER